MARRRFFVDGIRNGRAELTGEDARHLTRVLRVEAGEQFEISDNRRAWLAEVESARKDHIVFRTLEALGEDPAGEPVILMAALFKFDRFEWLIEKATEIGVDVVVPVRSARSEAGLERAAEKRVERWRRIAVEASQQSRRTRLPEIEEPVGFEEALGRAAAGRLFLDEQRDGEPLVPAVRAAPGSLAVLCGPEGGWTGQERDAAAGSGWTPVSLGPRILRAETAAIAALAVVQAVRQSG